VNKKACPAGGTLIMEDVSDTREEEKENGGHLVLRETTPFSLVASLTNYV